MSNIFFALSLISMLAVLGSLAGGLITMARGGETSKKYGNKFMRARIFLQGAAVVFLLLAMVTSNA